MNMPTISASHDYYICISDRKTNVLVGFIRTYGKGFMQTNALKHVLRRKLFLTKNVCTFKYLFITATVLLTNFYLYVTLLKNISKTSEKTVDINMLYLRQSPKSCF